MGNETRIELLEQIIKDFNKDTLIQFYKLSSDKFRPLSEDFSDNLPKDDKRFESIEQIGRIEHEKKAQSIAFFISSVSGEISERDSKKRQYDIGKKILRDNYLDAGIFVFYGKNNFRLSLIAASYSGPKRKFTTFKRYTYFVSPELTNKTFKDQLKKCDFSSIEAILESFSIEAVNKDFYTQIAKKFTDLVGGWLKIGSKKYEREGCLVWSDSSDEKRKEFAVRLVGRLVFCWFLKKKHSEPSNIPLVPKDILSLDAANNNDSYYRFVLEPLFFQVLNKKSNDRHKKYKTNGWDKIPFLNGGLFTPHSDDYYNPDDFQGISPRGDVKVPDEWLRELLEIFERYNFTIDENTPVDIEISIDPEMLGRIFENLLAMINPETGETARKSTGSYYTPRPIVEYMVDQSIKQYLLTQTNIPEENIDSLLDYSQETSDVSLTDKQNDNVIDALDKLKVLDPACGSGAFPIGILQKILLILQKVDPDSAKWKTRLLAKIPNTAARKTLAEKLESETWQYIHKLGVIQSSIYGVDIQPIATEISKLRIFLSLIVDETVNDNKDNRGIEPLPNLKYKFVCGNSLIDKYMGRIIDTDNSVQTESKKIIDKLTGLKADFFSAEKDEEKVEYNLKILQSKIELAEQLLTDLKDKNQFTDILFGDESQTEKQKQEKKEAIIKQAQAELLNKAVENARTDIDDLIAKPQVELAEVEQLETKHFTESFIWKMDFAEIFTENNGFDIVIGNPPYVEHKKLKTYSKLFKANYKCYAGTADLYIYFIEKSISLLKQNGTLSFITSNKFIKTSYGENVRKLLSEKTIANLIDFTKVHVFDALVASCVLIVNNCQSSSKVTVVFVDDEIKTLSLNGFISKYHQEIDKKQLGSKIWILESDEKLKIKELIENDSTILEKINGVQIFRGVTTGYNPAFIIDDEKRRELISADKKNKEIIKPILQGRNIKKWSYFFNTEYLLFIPWHFPLHKSDIKGASLEAEMALKKSHPSIFSHLSHSKTKLSERNREETGIRYEWYALQRCAATYYEEFEKEKIIWGLTADKWAFAYDNNKHYLPSNGYILTSTEISIKYLLALLNSKLMECYFSFEGIMTAGGAYTLKHETIGKFPIKCLDEQGYKQFEDLVDLILAKKEKDEDITPEEEKIDKMVYKLYGLTKEEIEIVENSFKA